MARVKKFKDEREREVETMLIDKFRSSAQDKFRMYKEESWFKGLEAYKGKINKPIKFWATLL